MSYSKYLSSVMSHDIFVHVKAVRIWSLTASLLPVLLGTVLAYRDASAFHPIIFILTFSCVSFVHLAGNLINTYYDYKYGVDLPKVADDRTLVDHYLKPSDVSNMCLVFYSISLLSFLAVSQLSPLRLEYAALLFFVGLSGSFLYTGGVGFKYYALGDVLIFILFGPVAVTFSYMLQTGTFAIKTIMFAAPLAFGTEAILHCNNTRDIEGDQRSGVRTVAIVLGKQLSYVFFCFLLFTPYLMITYPACKISLLIFLPLLTISQAFEIEKEFRHQNVEKLPPKTAKLMFNFGSVYIISILLSNWVHF